MIARAFLSEMFLKIMADSRNSVLTAVRGAFLYGLCIAVRQPLPNISGMPPQCIPVPPEVHGKAMALNPHDRCPG